MWHIINTFNDSYYIVTTHHAANVNSFVKNHPWHLNIELWNGISYNARSSVMYMQVPLSELLYQPIKNLYMLTILYFMLCGLWGTISNFHKTLPLVLQHQQGLGNLFDPSVCMEAAITRTKLFCALATNDVTFKTFQSY